MTALSFDSKDNEGNQNLFFGFGQGMEMERSNFYRILVIPAFEHGDAQLCDGEREEREVSVRTLIVPMLCVGMQFWTFCVLSRVSGTEHYGRVPMPSIGT
ncbi:MULTISPECIES: hypothetical protein [Pseudomonas syringae group]|uniref:hypothetical protein n=1 Tax=Pseudomonas syringae group TaxID=136849 RepID=UPI000EFE72BC|nr:MULTISPECIES: hypothetical protein [Pseudomonas syringae group]MCF5802528.1 hypothetical protein [Pseudomonas tremae]